MTFDLSLVGALLCIVLSIRVCINLDKDIKELKRNEVDVDEYFR